MGCGSRPGDSWAHTLGQERLCVLALKEEALTASICLLNQIQRPGFLGHLLILVCGNFLLLSLFSKYPSVSLGFLASMLHRLLSLKMGQATLVLGTWGLKGLAGAPGPSCSWLPGGGGMWIPGGMWSGCLFGCFFSFVFMFLGNLPISM